MQQHFLWILTLNFDEGKNNERNISFGFYRSLQLLETINNQGCQMVCFQTKNPNLGKFWRVLQWKMFQVFFNKYNPPKTETLNQAFINIGRNKM
jgi:hypothetical protein